MIRKHSGALALATAALLGLATADLLHAQERNRGGMMDMMSMMDDCPMMRGMAEEPAAALEHREELGLSAEQVERLEAIRRRTTETQRATQDRMQQIHQEIRTATGGELFDEAAARAAFDRMGDLHTEIGLSLLRARHEARATLTSEQRQKLAELGRRGPGMHGMMEMMGMMRDCPMMNGGG